MIGAGGGWVADEGSPVAGEVDEGALDLCGVPGGEGADGDLDTQLLANLAGEGLLRRFARLDLAARELPEAAGGAVGEAAGGEEERALA